MEKVYSHSRLSCFEQCPYKFKLKYIDKIIPEIEQSIEALLGKCVHDSLEWLYNQIKEKGKHPSVEDLIKKYIDLWEKSYSPEIKIVRNGQTPKDYFNKGIQFLLDYFTKHQPFSDGTIECEKEITINLDGEYKIKGFIDRLVHNIEEGYFEIHDYKTANSLPTREKIESDRQLALYSIAIKEIYGKDKEVKLIWHYLAHNTKIISTRTDEQLKKLKEEITNLIQEIEASQEFPTKKSILCDWCEYKSLCYEFGGKPDVRQHKLDIFTNIDDKILKE